MKRLAQLGIAWTLIFVGACLIVTGPVLSLRGKPIMNVDWWLDSPMISVTQERSTGSMIIRALPIIGLGVVTLFAGVG
jgi:hypothetical protein